MIKIALVIILCWTEMLLRQAVADPQSKLAELPLNKLLNVKYAFESEKTRNSDDFPQTIREDPDLMGSSSDVQDISRLLSETTNELEEDVEMEVDVEEELEGGGDQGDGGGAMPLKGDWFQMSKPRKKPTKLPDRRGDWEHEKGEKKGDVSKIFQTTVTVLAFLAFGGYLLCMICMSIRNNQGFFQTTTTVAPTAAVRPGGRRRRHANDDRNWIVGSIVIPDSPFVETLTEGLHRLAEGYAKFHFEHK